MFLTARNILKAWLLLGGFVAGFTALGWWIGGLGLASVFFVVCLLMAATVFWYGPRIVLASLGARELTLAEATLLHTTIERLAARAGVGRPRVYLLPSIKNCRAAALAKTSVSYIAKNISPARSGSFSRQ